MSSKHTPGLVEACAPIVAIVDALDKVHGFPDDKPVDTRHMGGKYNDWPGLTWGDLRTIRAAIAAAEGKTNER